MGLIRVYRPPSHNHSLTYSLAHSPTDRPTDPLTHSLTHSLVSWLGVDSRLQAIRDAFKSPAKTDPPARDRVPQAKGRDILAVVEDTDGEEAAKHRAIRKTILSPTRKTIQTGHVSGGKNFFEKAMARAPTTAQIKYGNIDDIFGTISRPFPRRNAIPPAGGHDVRRAHAYGILIDAD